MIALRLVIDTNVVVSAALKPDGLERAVLVLALTKPAHLYVSGDIFAEYGAVLGRPELRIRKGLRLRFLQEIRNRARLTVPRSRLSVATDPNDNIFVECAEAARADYLITGNRRHFPAFWKSTKVVTSREFMQVVAPHLLQS